MVQVRANRGRLVQDPRLGRDVKEHIHQQRVLRAIHQLHNSALNAILVQTDMRVPSAFARQSLQEKLVDIRSNAVCECSYRFPLRILLGPICCLLLCVGTYVMFVPHSAISNQEYHRKVGGGLVWQDSPGPATNTILQVKTIKRVCERHSC